jgi:hypothetical protein
VEKPRIPWVRFLAEAVLIVSSVYLAIVLEGISDDREREAEAISALSYLRTELGQDRADFDEVISVQEGHGHRYANTIRWLGTPRDMPTDSFALEVAEVVNNNRTIFPRNSSWRTMVASGQLPHLGDQDLVAQLANLYEHSSARVEYNGANYDDGVEDLARNAMPLVWDRVDNRLISTDPASIAAFRGQLEYLYDWNTFYRELLTAWVDELDQVISNVDRYLEINGGGA